MFLSDRDLKHAIECGALIVEPRPHEYDTNAIELGLGTLGEAKIWDQQKLEERQGLGGMSNDVTPPPLMLGKFNYNDFADACLVHVPTIDDLTIPDKPPVYINGGQVYVKPFGFLLWTTKEEVGSPSVHPELVSFVNAKSTKARTGIMVHFTAPTINAGWQGKITLEIINLGPFTLVLRPGDKIAQLTVAKLTSSPEPKMLTKKKSMTKGQTDPGGKRQ